MQARNRRGMEREVVARMTSTEETEPKGSASSSPDESCACGHARRLHPTLAQGRCVGEVITPAGDDRENCRCGAFIPAKRQDMQDFCALCKHHGRFHVETMCTVCPAFTGDHRHAFEHRHDWSDWKKPYISPGTFDAEMRLCACGAVEHRNPASAEPECDGCEHGSHRPNPCDGRDCACGHVVPEPKSRYCGKGGVCRDPLKRCGLKCRRAEPEAPGYDDSWHDSSPCEGCGHFVLDHIDGACKALGCPCGHDVPEPQAPEEPACRTCGQRAGDWFDRSVCAEPCGSAHNRCSNCGAVTGDACLNETPAPEAQPPRRPPYAVAYVLQDGTHYEVALPGDATVCALDGALLITHAQSPVKGLTQARPMEGA
jgi:hypothetical protein